MKPRTVEIPYSIVFPFSLDRTFAWLTDYDERDPTRTPTIVKKRRVVSRDGNRIVLEGQIHSFGGVADGTAEVVLDPPRHYTATLVSGRGRGMEVDYRLTPVANGTRLDVVYQLRVRRWRGRLKLFLGRPVFRHEIARMWKGFADSMKQELGASPPT